jgi:hypothetical protein
MIKTPDELLALRFGEASVAENLRRAVEAGRLVENDRGLLESPGDPKRDLNWIFVDHGPGLGCGFLMGFAFNHAYAESAVPSGCSACYKVKVLPKTLRQLVAAWEIAKKIQCRSKWGTDLNNPYSQNIYAGYFYVSGVDAARTLFDVVRQAFGEHPQLGPAVPMVIKRGCSEYEAKLGPSDRYTFAPEMAELEAYLKSRFRDRETDYQPSLIVAHWIETAFRTGDETYLDFTAGKRLRERTLTYDPA